MASPSLDLQKAVKLALEADATVGALAGDRVYDKAPASAQMPYISFANNDFFRQDLDCIDLRIEALQIDVWSRAEGRQWPAKQLVDAVVKCLHLAELDLETHALAFLEARGQTFLDQDGITAHGVVSLEAEIEER